MNHDDVGPDWDDMEHKVGEDGEDDESLHFQETHIRRTSLLDRHGKTVKEIISGIRVRIISDGETGKLETESVTPRIQCACGCNIEINESKLTESGKYVCQKHFVTCANCSHTIDPDDFVIIFKLDYHKRCAVAFLKELIWQERENPGSIDAASMARIRTLYSDLRRELAGHSIRSLGKRIGSFLKPSQRNTMLPEKG